MPERDAAAAGRRRDRAHGDGGHPSRPHMEARMTPGGKMRRALARAWRSASGVLALTAVAGLCSGSYPWPSFAKYFSVAAVGFVVGRLARVEVYRELEHRG